MAADLILTDVGGRDAAGLGRKACLFSTSRLRSRRMRYVHSTIQRRFGWINLGHGEGLPCCFALLKGLINRSGDRMKKYRGTRRAAFAAISYCLLSSAAPSIATQVINPVGDGAVNNGQCFGCATSIDKSYVIVSSFWDGIVKFSRSDISGTVADAKFTLTTPGTSLFETNVQVFGFGSSFGQLDATDAGAGSFLGVMNFSPDGGVGTFDVTAFLNTSISSFVGFRLATPNNIGTDLFGSLDAGVPGKLSFDLTDPGPPSSAVPENASWIMMIAGFGLVGLAMRKRHGLHTIVAGIS